MQRHGIHETENAQEAHSQIASKDYTLEERRCQHKSGQNAIHQHEQLLLLLQVLLMWRQLPVLLLLLPTPSE